MTFVGPQVERANMLLVVLVLMVLRLLVVRLMMTLALIWMMMVEEGQPVREDDSVSHDASSYLQIVTKSLKR